MARKGKGPLLLLQREVEDLRKQVRQTILFKSFLAVLK